MSPQLALSLGERRARRRRWPAAWPETLFYASGTNDPGEIRGFAELGIPIGFCAGHVGDASVAELERLTGTGMPLFDDTGAYGEVAPSGSPGGGLEVVRPITPGAWDERLAVYDRVATLFGRRFDAVAPDRVGDQPESLERLLRFRIPIRSLAARGARILLPLHRGERTLPAFFAEARRALGTDMVPAFPMPNITGY